MIDKVKDCNNRSCPVKRFLILAFACPFVCLWGGLLGTSCLSARNINPKSYFVLSGMHPKQEAGFKIDSLVRVQDLDAETLYEKFQLVVRKSPHELRYSSENLWAVKPDVAIADEMANSLDEMRVFAAVTRTLGDARPKYFISGKLKALEVWVSEDDDWSVRLSLLLRLSRFGESESIAEVRFDQKKPLKEANYRVAVEVLSALLDEANLEFVSAIKSAVDAEKL